MKVFEKLSRPELTAETDLPWHSNYHDIAIDLIFFVLAELLVFSKNRDQEMALNGKWQDGSNCQNRF